MSTPLLSVSPSRPITHPSPARSVAGWSLVQVALFSSTLIVLGSAIGWPGILRAPAAEVLPTIHGHALATTIGYSFYLVASMAQIGLALALRRLLGPAQRDTGALDLLTTLGAASGVLKTLGIVRWLSVMPGLAAAHASPATAPAMLPSIELVYTSMNAYAGAVGELLGVQLFSGLWMLGIGVLLLRSGWRIVGGLGLVTGATFVLTALRIFHDGFAALNVLAGPMGLAWCLLLGIAAWRHRDDAAAA